MQLARGWGSLYLRRKLVRCTRAGIIIVVFVSFALKIRESSFKYFVLGNVLCTMVVALKIKVIVYTSCLTTSPRYVLLYIS